MASNNNQETDKAAMVGDSIIKSMPPILVKSKSTNAKRNPTAATFSTLKMPKMIAATTADRDAADTAESIASEISVVAQSASMAKNFELAANKNVADEDATIFTVISSPSQAKCASSIAAAYFVVPEVPPVKHAQVKTCNNYSSSINATTSTAKTTSSSIKKKQSNKCAKKYSQQQQQHPQQSPRMDVKNQYCNYRCRGSDDTGCRSNCGDGAAVIASSIKTSLSMTSLPPDGGEKQEGCETMNVKLKVERPYNSLKKNVDRNVGGSNLLSFHNGGYAHTGKQHRLSWGSTSSSLHSSTTFAFGSGKDDLWAAIQTNYNYIMDTNLLDSCKEARHEIENKTNVTAENPIECCFQMLSGTHRRQRFFCEDPKDLRKWLQEMEKKLGNAPSLFEATSLSTAELQRHLAEHSVLYHEIVSHARGVSACIRAATEREQELRLQQQQQQQRQQIEEQQQQSLDSNGSSLIGEHNTSSSLSSTDEAISLTTTITTSAAAVTNLNSVASASGSNNIAAVTTASSGIDITDSNSVEGKRSTATSRPDGTLSTVTTTTSLSKPPPASSTRTSKKAAAECSLDRLQNRYHLLYLKAFEIQLWLDGLLRKKSSPECDKNDYNEENIDGDSFEDDDYEVDIYANSSGCVNNENNRDEVDDVIGIATEDDLVDAVSDLESDGTYNSTAPPDFAVVQCRTLLIDNEEERNHNEDNAELVRSTKRATYQQEQQHDTTPKETEFVDFDEGDDEDDREKENAYHGFKKTYFLNQKRRRFHGGGASFGSSSAYSGYNKKKCLTTNTAALTGFDADSESSEIEELSLSHFQKLRKLPTGGEGGVGGGSSLSALSITPTATVTCVGKLLNALQRSFECTQDEENFEKDFKQQEMNASAESKNKSTICAISFLQKDTKTEINMSTIEKNAHTVSAEQQPCFADDQASNTFQMPKKTLRSSLSMCSSADSQDVILTNTTTTTMSQQNIRKGDFQHQHGSGGGSTSSSNSKQPKNIAIVSPNSHNSLAKLDAAADVATAGDDDESFCKSKNYKVLKNNSPIMLRKRQHKHRPPQHHHQQQQTPQQPHADISKFNRSNRKSKNCAVFYFKHLDTDNETTNYNGTSSGSGSTAAETLTGEAYVNIDVDCNGGDDISSSASHASDVLKCEVASSDDEDDDGGWLYTSTAKTTPKLTENSIKKKSSQQQTTTLCVVVNDIQSSAVSSSTLSDKQKRIDDSCDSVKENEIKRNDALAQLSAIATNSNNNNNAATVSNLLQQQQKQQQSSNYSFSTISSMNSTQTDLKLSANIDIDTTKTTMRTKTSKRKIIAATNTQTGNYCSKSSSSSNNLLEEISTITKAITATATATIASTATPEHPNNQHSACLKMKSTGGTELDMLQDKSARINCNNESCHTNNNNKNNANNKNNNNYNKNNNPNNVANELTTAMNRQKSSLMIGTETVADDAKNEALQKDKISHESIKQLVIEAEHLVRDDLLKTPTKHPRNHSHNHHHYNHNNTIVKMPSKIKKCEVYGAGPIKQRVQDWLEHHPTLSSPPNNMLSSTRTDDCEASAEASETDSLPQPGSDTSEGLTDSIATCMQTSTNSYGNSTERIGGSAEPMTSSTGTAQYFYGSSNQSLNVKIIKRPQTRRKSERPWSVSCLSQLTADATQVSTSVASVASVVQAGLATHSISESALDSISSGRQNNTTTHVATQVKTLESKSSLKRRKIRKKKHSNTNSGGRVHSLLCASAATTHSTNRNSDSCSDKSTDISKKTQSLLMKSCESMTVQEIQEITNALLDLQKKTGASSASLEKVESGNGSSSEAAYKKSNDREDINGQLMKPNFRVGSYTTSYMRNEARLGSLAALASYMHDDDQLGEYTTGTEDHHSSFSETAWDNYQEKYNSENYSEGFDSDAARRLMEFGDDYRNFIDSQSDCCSSLSAANNLDSLTPPRMDSLQQKQQQSDNNQATNSNNVVDHSRRKRALEFEYERRRKAFETRRKSCQDAIENTNLRSPSVSLSSSANALTPKNSAINDEKFHNNHKTESTSRKLEFSGMSLSAQSLRRTSESDTSTRRRKVDERRRSSRNLEKCIKMLPATTSSSSFEDSDDGEREMCTLLQHSQNRLEDTRSLKIRCHLLRPEDYTEIINTCRDNIHCLESVLRGPPGTVLSAHCVNQTKDLLAAWSDLLAWSENSAEARKLQEEMFMLKNTLNRLGRQSSFELLDTEPALQIAIEALNNEKTHLQTYRSKMLRLNASVHRWLTRSECKQQTQHQQQMAEKSFSLNKNTANIAAVASKNVEQQVETNTTTTSAATSTKMASTASTDNNGNKVETQSFAIVAKDATDAINRLATNASESTHDLPEHEFHNHLKDEVSDMYSAWDEADARINTQLEIMTTSLVTWRQLECGLSEFQQTLGQDRGTLKGLEGALNKGHTTPNELAQNVKLVAKLLSENVNLSQAQLSAAKEHLDPQRILNITQFTTGSCGSLSDSGISDGGAISDGGLSERERRLGVLRRLAKQLECALAPGSEAMKSIAARMESAESELKQLQNTCRDLIVRTASTHESNKKQFLKNHMDEIAKESISILNNDKAGFIKANGHTEVKNTHLHNAMASKLHASESVCLSSTESINNSKKTADSLGDGLSNNDPLDGNDADPNLTAPNEDTTLASKTLNKRKTVHFAVMPPDDSGDPYDDPPLEFGFNENMGNDDDDGHAGRKRGWMTRIIRAAVPLQMALVTFLFAAAMMQPNCCDNLNNMVYSLTPQLRYIRGPPPI